MAESPWKDLVLGSRIGYLPMLRSAYVAFARAGRAVAQRTGLLARLERSGTSAVRHLRTLFAIHDAQDLASLDLPWWTYRAIREVDAFLLGRSDARAFEFGSGASTVFLARRVASLHSVEHEPSFADVVRGMINAMEHVELHAVVPRPVSAAAAGIRSSRSGHENLDFSEYVEEIDRVGGMFDLIVVDGRARLECLRRAIPHLAEDGLLVFDDVGRSRYRPALSVPGLQARVLRGLRPCLPYPTSTALLRPSPR